MFQMKESTRERLLDVGERLFAERGLDGVSVREIAGEAEANLAAVNYHFRGKEGLYEEVIRRRMAPKRDRIISSLEELRARSETPDLEAIIRAVIDAHIRDTLDPSHWETSLRLFAREAHTQGHASGILQAELIQPVQRIMMEILAEARPDILPRRMGWIVMSAIGQLLFFMMRWYARRTGLGVDVDAISAGIFPDDHEEFIEMVVDHVSRLSATGAEAFAGETEQGVGS